MTTVKQMIDSLSNAIELMIINGEFDKFEAIKYNGGIKFTITFDSDYILQGFSTDISKENIGVVFYSQEVFNPNIDVKNDLLKEKLRSYIFENIESSEELRIKQLKDQLENINREIKEIEGKPTT